MPALEKLKDAFHFLTTDLGFRVVQEQSNINTRGISVVFYRNDLSNVQLEFAAGDTWFHCEVRRLINGGLPKYSDKENSLGFTSLAILETDNNYEHFDYVALGNGGLENALKNTAALLKRNVKVLTTTQWIDVAKVERLRNAAFEAKFGTTSKSDAPSYWDQVKKLFTDYLGGKGFVLMNDSDEHPPWHEDWPFKYIVFRRENKSIFKRKYTTVKFLQADWRDLVHIYYLEINGSREYEINTIKVGGIEKAVALTLRQLKYFL